ncbi:MAG: hypothetical protein M0Z43_00310 [Acidithiobacillus sp.]|nr:hypothetical protein [Acidithiobacillus sp.]
MNAGGKPKDYTGIEGISALVIAILAAAPKTGIPMMLTFTVALVFILGVFHLSIRLWPIKNTPKSHIIRTLLVVLAYLFLSFSVFFVRILQ